MKKVLKITAASLGAIIISLLILNQFTMRNLNTSITINSTPDKIWNALLDYDAYSEWNPFIKSISGTPEVGEHLEVIIAPGEKNPMTFKPEVLVNKENEEFRWLGVWGIKGIVDGEHYFELEQIGENQTRFTQGENFTGLLSGLMVQMMGADTEKGFNEMNVALKVLVETQESNLATY